MNSLKRKLIDLVPRKLLFQGHSAFCRMRSLAYGGDAVTCSICAMSFRTFLAGGERIPVCEQYEVIGQSLHPAGYCVRCYASDRDRLIHLYLAEEMKLFDPDVAKQTAFLHVAPEWTLAPQMRTLNFARYVNGDLEPWLSKTVIDLTNVPFEDESFDLVMANHVLEHIPDVEKAMREIHRVLKPGGRAIVQVPLTTKVSESIECEGDPFALSDQERIDRFGQRDHVRIFAREDYVKRLGAVGFRVELFDWQEAYSEVGSRSVLNPRERVVVCFK